MTNEERAAKLAQAEALVTEVRDSFKNEKVICTHCGFERFKDYNERQMREQLNGAITRLSRVADRINRTEGMDDWFHANPKRWQRPGDQEEGS